MTWQGVAQAHPGPLPEGRVRPTVWVMKYLVLLPAFALAACDDALMGFQPAAPDVPVETVETLDPTPPPPPPPEARTVEEFDTTTAEDRAEALEAPSVGGEERLGTTIASLGPPAEPGIWLETPLTDRLAEGRAEWQSNSVNLELRPSGGAPGSGSQISLAAMRLLEIPLTELPEITVYRQNAAGS